jgi:cytochrome c-type biogenesis protein CcmH/NrfF
MGVAIACATGSPTADERSRAIEREVWSPYCPGRLLVDCTTQQARELRDEISRRVERGDSSQEVLDWIRRNHGDEALARPDARGTGLAVWLVPVAIFAVGAIVVGRLIRRWSRAPAERVADPDL